MDALCGKNKSLEQEKELFKVTARKGHPKMNLNRPFTRKPNLSAGAKFCFTRKSLEHFAWNFGEGLSWILYFLIIDHDLYSPYIDPMVDDGHLMVRRLTICAGPRICNGTQPSG